MIEAVAYFNVLPGQQGEWTFGIRSDDGHRLRIDGQTLTLDDALHAPQDRVGTKLLTAGLHSLELTYFERSGGASLELVVAAGSHTSFNTAFDLFSSSVFAIDDGIQVRYRESTSAVTSLADGDALLSEPNHNLVDYFAENSGHACSFRRPSREIWTALPTALLVLTSFRRWRSTRIANGVWPSRWRMTTLTFPYTTRTRRTA